MMNAEAEAARVNSKQQVDPQLCAFEPRTGSAWRRLFDWQLSLHCLRWASCQEALSPQVPAGHRSVSLSRIIYQHL